MSLVLTYEECLLRGGFPELSTEHCPSVSMFAGVHTLSQLGHPNIEPEDRSLDCPGGSTGSQVYLTAVKVLSVAVLLQWKTS